MNEQTRHNFIRVTIEEYYIKEGSDVFRIWRYEGGEWNKQLTPLQYFPTVELKRGEQNPDWETS
jgi:hypothetical protein